MVVDGEVPAVEREDERDERLFGYRYAASPEAPLTQHRAVYDQHQMQRISHQQWVMQPMQQNAPPQAFAGGQAMQSWGGGPLTAQWGASFFLFRWECLRRLEQLD